MLGPAELHAGCVASVRRLTHSGQYATYQNVVQSVLQSYNVYRFQDIGVGDPSYRHELHVPKSHAFISIGTGTSVSPLNGQAQMDLVLLEHSQRLLDNR